MSDRPNATLVNSDSNLLLQFVATRSIKQNKFHIIMSITWTGEDWLAVPKDRKIPSLLIVSNGNRFKLKALSVSADVSAQTCVASTSYCVIKHRTENALYAVSRDFLIKVVAAKGMVAVRFMGTKNSFTAFVPPDAKRCIRDFVIAVMKEEGKRSENRIQRKQSKHPSSHSFPVF